MFFDDDFFGDFDDFFKIRVNNFTRPVKDMTPTNYYKTDDGYIIVCNTLGMAKEDISVTLSAEEKGYGYPVLTIRGKTKIDKIKFENSINLKLGLTFNEKIKDVEYDVKNGLTYILLKCDHKKEDKTNIIKGKYKSEEDW